MESPAHGDLVHLMTNYYFGETVATVIKLLYNYDQTSLRFLKTIEPNLSGEDLKKALLILVKYQLVDYVKTLKNFEYSAVPRRIFYFYRLPQYIYTAQLQEGQLAADVLSILGETGMISRAKLKERSIKFTKDFRGDSYNASLPQDFDAIITSLIHRKFLAEMSDNICLNLERYNRQHRDHMIIETLSDHYNKEPKIKSICQAMIDISFDNTSDEALITAPVPLANLKNLLCPKVIPEPKLEQYMIRLTSEVNYRFILPSGTHPQKGPMYAINIGAVIDHLMKEHLCSVITTRYGPKCCRVFRVLLQRGPLLLKQIEEFIMLPTKDVREYSYMLIKDGLIRNRQVPKTLDNAPGKSVFIMSVELDQVVFRVADLCCHAMSNILLRYDFELKRNEPLLKKAKASDEWMEYFNSHELSQLDWTNKVLHRLLLARTQVDETLFVTHVWLKMRPNVA